MTNQVTIAVIGNSRLGRAIAGVVKASTLYTLHSHLPARSRSFTALSDTARKDGPEVLFIITKDSEIASTAKKAAKYCGKNLKLIVHCAGSLAPDILPMIQGVGRVTLHPLQTISVPEPKLLKGISWMICTNSKYGQSFAKTFTHTLKAAQTLRLHSSQLPTYHALTVFASNFTTLIGASVEKLAGSLGVSQKVIKLAVGPLMQQSLENVLTHQAKKVLTGPIARNDNATILRNRKALRNEDPALRKIYEGFVMLGTSIKVR